MMIKRLKKRDFIKGLDLILKFEDRIQNSNCKDEIMFYIEFKYDKIEDIKLLLLDYPEFNFKKSKKYKDFIYLIY